MARYYRAQWTDFCVITAGDCANCANKMEEATKKTPGVKNATINFMALKLIVEFEEGVDVEAVMKEVVKNCKVVEDDCVIYL